MAFERTDPAEWAVVDDLYPTLRRFAAVAAPSDLDPDDLLQDAFTRVLQRRALTELVNVLWAFDVYEGVEEVQLNPKKTKVVQVTEYFRSWADGATFTGADSVLVTGSFVVVSYSPDGIETLGSTDLAFMIEIAPIG
jgi:hypothetical protein